MAGEARSDRVPSTRARTIAPSVHAVLGALGAMLASGCAAAPSVDAQGPDRSGALDAGIVSLEEAGAAQDGAGDGATDDGSGRFVDAARPLGVRASWSDGGAGVGDAGAFALADEMPYPPSARPRPKGAIAASNDDESLARWNVGSGGGIPARPAHPAPRVRVDVVAASGKVRAAEVERAARSRGYWPIRLCYEEALRQTQKLHAELRVQLALSATGAIRAATAHHPAAESKELASCITHALRPLTLVGPARGTAAATLRITLWPGDAPVAPKPVDQPASLPWPPAELQPILRAAWPEISACYAEGVRQDPALWGRLALELQVDPQGAVESVRETESRFPAPEVTLCVSRALRRLSFRPPGQAQRVVYALRLGGPPEPR